MAKRILVLVIEDNRLVRDGREALLRAQPDFKSVAAVEGGNESLLQAEQLEKLALRSRLQIAAYAYKAGAAPPPS
jgi:hypothetical protein